MIDTESLATFNEEERVVMDFDDWDDDDDVAQRGLSWTGLEQRRNDEIICP